MLTLGGMVLDVVSGGVTVAERVLALVAKGKLVLTQEASAAEPGPAAAPRK
jgi:hypothetical protein